MCAWVIDHWTHCYGGKGWKGRVVPEALEHPAKVSFKLAARIWAHMAEEGWIEHESVCLDPFAGIGGFAFHALGKGVHFIGVELEPKWAGLGQANIDAWRIRWPHLKGTARVVQGDSRRLREVLAEAGFALAVSSPAYATGAQHAGGADQHQERMEGGELRFVDYGSASGQLAAMPEGNVDAAIASAPFLQSSGGTNVTSTEGPLADGALLARHAAGNAAAHGYGQAQGQIQAMPEGKIDGVISSPAYEELSLSGGGGIANEMRSVYRDGRNYGDDDFQIGAMMGDTFWSASRAVIEQVYALLRPGGHAVWVCGDYVRNHQIVPFCDNWRRLCESVGFVTLHQHIAMKVRNPGDQLAWDGNHKSNRRANLSFFRHLANKRGEAIVDSESVFCMQKGESK